MKKLLLIFCWMTPMYGMQEQPLSSSSSSSHSAADAEEATLLKSEFDSDDRDMRLFTDLSADELKAKSTMHTLDISHINLSSVKRLSNFPQQLGMPPVIHYQTITQIILAHNALKGICAHDFERFENLNHLNMSHNKLQRVDIGSFFEACPNLKCLDVSHNEIKTVAWSWHPVWKKLSRKDAHSLPRINCVGNNIALVDQQWLKERYANEEIRLRKSLSIFEGMCWGSGGGTIMGGVSAGFGCCFIKLVTPCVLWGLPIGCVVGSLIGCGFGYNCIGDLSGQEHIYFDPIDIPITIATDKDEGLQTCCFQCPLKS